MGMYTMLELDIVLREDTPDPVIEAIKIMCGNSGSKKQSSLDNLIEANPWMNHSLFETWRGSWQFRCDSAYFDNWAAPVFVKKTDKRYELRVSFNVKNYENSIEKFLDWVSPYIIPYVDGTVVGRYRYEENFNDSLVIARDNKLNIIVEGAGD